MKNIFALLFFLIATNIYSYAQTQFSVMLHEQATQYNEKEIIALEDGGYVTKELIYDPIVNNGWSMYHVVLTKFNACNQGIWSKKINLYGGGSGTVLDDQLNFLETFDKGFLLIYYSYLPASI